MKLIILLSLLIIYTGNTFAQRDTFDLISFTPPNGWTKNVEATYVSYKIADREKNNWCRINVIKSTVSKGTIAADFENEWQELIVKDYNCTENRKENDIIDAEGWKIKSAGSIHCMEKQKN